MSLGRIGGWSDRRPGAPPRALVERGVVASCDGIAYEGRDCLSKLRDAFPRPRARDDRLVRVESQRRRERPLPAPALALRKLVALRGAASTRVWRAAKRSCMAPSSSEGARRMSRSHTTPASRARSRQPVSRRWNAARSVLLALA